MLQTLSQKSPPSYFVYARKDKIQEWADRTAPERDRWIAWNAYYYAEDRRHMQYLVPKGMRVLDIGCGTGDLLAALQPSIGVGIDLSARMVEYARRKYQNLDFRQGDIEDPEFISSLSMKFDYIIISDTIGLLEDIETALGLLHSLCTSETRLIIAYYSHIWEPLLTLASKAGLRMQQPPTNYLSNTDFLNILDLADFEAIKHDARQLIPRRFLGIGSFLNRYIAPLPIINRLCLRTYIVARSHRIRENEDVSTSVIIPCRNERGNIEPAIQRLPRFGSHVEVVFVEGNSSDGTYEECLRIQQVYGKDWDIKVYKQLGKGKGDAVRKGFEEARGDILMILDADLTVPPEAMPKFYFAVSSGKGEFVNGTRLVYPRQKAAMKLLNFMANRAFALIFSYLVNQRFTDTLCGTKALRKRDYQKIAAGRSYFGTFDPFGDFDLIFGAAKQNLKILEIPVHYGARAYGSTQISRFRDGFLLLRMVIFAFRKLKAL